MKICRYFAVALLLGSFLGAAATARADILDDLSSYWSFDGDFTDQVGTHDGTGTGVGFDAGDWILGGQAASFQAIDSVVDLGDVDAMDQPGAFSIQLWFRRTADQVDPTNHGVDNVLIAQSSDDENDNLEIGTSGGDIEIYFDTLGKDGPSPQTYSEGITDATWHHLVMTYDQARTNEMALYLDGQLAVEDSQWGGTLDDSAGSSLSLGLARPLNNNGTVGDEMWGNFYGLMDEVGLWTRALSTAEVSALYNGGAGMAFVPDGTLTSTGVETDWDTAATWAGDVPGGVPTTLSNVIVDGGDQVFVNSTTSVGRDLDIIEAGSVTIAAGQVLSISEDVNVDGTLPGDGATLAMAGTLNAASLNIVAGNSLELSGSPVINVDSLSLGQAPFVAAGTTASFNIADSLTLDADLDMTGSTLTTTGADVTIGPTATLTVDNQALQAASLDVAGSLVRTGATRDVTVTDALTLTGDSLDMTGSTLTTTAANVIVGAGQTLTVDNQAIQAASLDVAGSLVRTGAIRDVAVTDALTLTGDSLDMTGSTLTTTAADVIVGAGQTLTVDNQVLQAASLDIAGSLVRTGAVQDVAVTDALTLSGDSLDMTGSTLTTTAADVTVGAGQTLTVDNQAIQAASLDIAGSLVRTGAIRDVTVADALTLSGGSLDMTGSTLTATDAYVTVGSGSTLTLDAPLTTGTMDLSAGGSLVAGGHDLTVSAGLKIPKVDFTLAAGDPALVASGADLSAPEQLTLNGGTVTVDLTAALPAGETMHYGFDNKLTPYVDSSPASNHDGNVMGDAPTWSDAGASYGAVTFGAGTGLQPQNFGFMENVFSEVAISMWVNHDGETTGSQMLLDEGGSTNGLGIILEDGVIKTRVQIDGSTNTTLVDPGGALTEGWHHLAVVFGREVDPGNPDGRSYELYRDGSLIASDYFGAASVKEHTDDPGIGYTQGSNPINGGRFLGSMDDLYYYERALDGADIAALYDNGVSPAGDLTGTNIDVTADTTLSIQGTMADFGQLTLAEGTTLTVGGTQGLWTRFAGTTLPTDATAIGLNTARDTEIGPFDAGLDTGGQPNTVTVTKTGGSTLLLNQPGVNLANTTISSAAGRLTILDPASAAGAALQLGGGKIVYSSSGGDALFTNPLTVIQSGEFNASGSGGLGADGPLTVTQDSGSGIVVPAGKTLTAGAYDDYTFEIVDPISGPGRLATGGTSTLTLTGTGPHTPGSLVMTTDSTLNIAAPVVADRMLVSAGAMNASADISVVAADLGGSAAIDMGSNTLTVSDRLRLGETNISITGGTFEATGGSLAASSDQLTVHGGTLTISAPTIVPTDNLQGYWQFDEVLSTTAVNQANPGSRNGTLANFPTDDSQWIQGPVGGALDFDGANDQVNITGYKGVTGATARTVSAWIKGTKDDAAIVSWGKNSGGQKWTFRMQTNNGTAGAIRVEVNGGFAVANTDLRDDEWHHVVAVLPEGADNVDQVLLYVDGQLDGSSDPADPNYYSSVTAKTIDTVSNADVRIGNDLSSRRFDGSIDDVLIYNRELSATEIAALYGDGYGPDRAPLPMTGTDLRFTESSTLVVQTNQAAACGTMSLDPGADLLVSGPATSFTMLGLEASHGTSTVEVDGNLATMLGTAEPGFVYGWGNAWTGPNTADIRNTEIHVAGDLNMADNWKVTVGGDEPPAADEQFTLFTYDTITANGAGGVLQNVAIEALDPNWDVTAAQVVDDGAGRVYLTGIDALVEMTFNDLDGNWAASANWDAGQAPDDYSMATMDRAGRTITVDDSIEPLGIAHRLLVNNGTVAVGSFGMLDVNTNVDIGAGGAVTVAADGSLLAPVVNNAGSLNIQSFAIADLAELNTSGSTTVVGDSATVIGTLNVTGGTSNIATPMIDTINATGGTLTTAADAIAMNVSNGATVSTTGALTETADVAGAGSSLAFDAAAGAIAVLTVSDSAQVDVNGAHMIEQLDLTSSAVVNVNAAGAAIENLNVDGAATLGVNAEAVAVNSMTVDTGGVVNAAERVVIGDQMVLGQAIYTPDDASVFQVSGTIDENGAETVILGGPGSTLTVDTGFTLLEAQIGSGLAGSLVTDGRSASVTGSGSDIWNAADHGYFAYQEFAVDEPIDLITRVEGFDGGTNGWRKTGLMIRDSLASDSRNAFAVIASSTANGVNAQLRPTDGADTLGSDVNASTANKVGRRFAHDAPVWLRLTYAGDGKSFNYYFSDDPEADDWTLINDPTWSTYHASPAELGADMTDTIYVGLAVTAHNNSELTTVGFDGISGFRQDQVAMTNLTGNGTLVADEVAIGGELAPGDSIGSITFDGDLAMTAGSTLASEISGDTSDLVAVAGALDLTDEPTLELTWLPGADATSSFGGTYRLMSYTGVLEGAFADPIDCAFEAYIIGDVQYGVDDDPADPNNPLGIDVELHDLLPGDVNLDGQVSIADLAIMGSAANWGTSDGSATWFTGDLNFDGNVSIADLAILGSSANWGSSLPADGLGAPAPVPEPGTIALLLMGLAGLGLRRKFRS